MRTVTRGMGRESETIGAGTLTCFESSKSCRYLHAPHPAKLRGFQHSLTPLATQVDPPSLAKLAPFAHGCCVPLYHSKHIPKSFGRVRTRSFVLTLFRTRRATPKAPTPRRFSKRRDPENRETPGRASLNLRTRQNNISSKNFCSKGHSPKSRQSRRRESKDFHLKDIQLRILFDFLSYADCLFRPRTLTGQCVSYVNR